MEGTMKVAVMEGIGKMGYTRRHRGGGGQRGQPPEGGGPGGSGAGQDLRPAMDKSVADKANIVKAVVKIAKEG